MTFKSYVHSSQFSENGTQQTESFRKLLFAGEKVIFKNHKDASDRDRLMQVKYRIRTINPAKIPGKLIDGNL
ncbi:hypothetical protein [Rivularia sp. PCC 7116]|uniref:hypothetical protein n=1 Tax=Rivularia sp. PCC 7116 TaxID=373994 RepID=UPI00030FE42D|nr:hypothetical protein [Rivularia sp. PCC 7116]